MSSDESKPSKKHKNNSSSAPPSCVQCKRNHKKCDKLEPKCSYCTSRNLECVYEEPKKRGRASELYQVNLKKKKECDGNLVDEYFDIICIGHPVIKKGVLEYFLNNYLHKIENNSSKRKISLEENEFITSLEDLNCIYVFYLSIKAVHHQLKSELEMADQFAKSAEIEVGKLFVDHAQNYYLYCACQQLSAFYNGRGDILKRKIYLSMVENYVSECLQDTSDIITKNLERRTVFLSKSMDELFSALPEFIEHFPRIVESSVDQKLDQLLLPGTLEYMKKAPITSENCMLFKQVIDFVFKVVVSLKSELFKQFEDCRTARFTEFMQLHIIFTYNSTSLSFYRNIPELRNLVEEMALKITMSTEHEVFKYIYSDAGIVLMLVSEIHIEICKLIESGLRQNNLPLITNNGKSITVDYFQILEKDLRALQSLSQKYVRIRNKSSNIILEMEEILERQKNPLIGLGLPSYDSILPPTTPFQQQQVISNIMPPLPQRDERLQSILTYLKAVSQTVQENIPNFSHSETLGDLEREFFEF